MNKQSIDLEINNNSLSFFKDKNRWLKQFQLNGIAVEHSMIEDEFCNDLIKEAYTFNKSGIYAPLMMPHFTKEIFSKFLKNPKIIAILKSIIKTEICGLQSQFFFGSPGTKGFTEHQDNFWVRSSDPSQFISVWTALSDVSPSNGGIYFWLGSHALGDLDVIDLKEDAGINQEQNARKTRVIFPSNSRIKKQDAYLSKGSVAFFHSQTVHGSYNNKSNQFRYALLNTYIGQECEFRSGNLAKRKKINLT